MMARVAARWSGASTVAVAAAVALSLAAATPCRAGTSTVTTTYQYNADGAPTALTTQVDGGKARTIYLTWDNFSPDAGAPQMGAVSAGNGNLIGIGAAPDGAATAFSYDARNRLTGCAADAASASFAYHPASLMASSTLGSGDVQEFYYDAATLPRMINAEQPSTGGVSSFLGPVRYLNDGTEQALLLPRKDVAGLYDATAETLAPYQYGPYGVTSSDSVDAAGVTDDGASYDLAHNPFLYAGEYRDPTCRASYLRARWYLPEPETFLSRDPVDPLHRYGYTGGNPVGRVDPSGFRFTGADFSRDVDKLVHRLTPGAWAYVEPVLPVWGQMLGGVELAGLLPSFWHRPTTQGFITFGFLSASIVGEALGQTPLFDRMATYSSRAFGSRLAFDVGLGTSQTFAQSYRHGRLDPAALVQGVETAVAGIFWTRLVAGVGYRPYNLTQDDVSDMVAKFYRDNPDSDDALVFRVREDLDGYNAQGKVGHYANRPVRDWANVGKYHEAVIAIGPEQQMRSEIIPDNTWDEVHEEYGSGAYLHVSDDTYEEGRAGYPIVEAGSGGARFIGRISAAQQRAFTGVNPFNYPDVSALDNPLAHQAPQERAYDSSFNNCHHHVNAVLKQMGF